MATRLKTILIIAPVYDQPLRTAGSVIKISEQLSKRARVVVFCGGTSDRREARSKNLVVYFNKELLIRDPVNNGVLPGMFRKLRAVLATERPDVVLNIKYMFYPNLCAPYLARKGYRVVTVTDTFPGYTWWSASWIVNAVMWFYTRTLGKYVLRSSDRVVLLHEGLVAQAKKLRLPYTVIPNGIDLPAVRAAKPKKLAGRVNVVYVGRLESVKGYETMFRAMEIVIAKDPSVHFYYVGETRGKEAFLRAHASANIHAVGHQSLSTVYSYLKGADIVLLASKSEGLPNVLLEGMACGCVPVSTPVGAVPYVLEHGKLGRLFPYENAPALARAVSELAGNATLRKKLSIACKRKIEREYNWENLVDEYYRVLFP